MNIYENERSIGKDGKKVEKNRKIYNG